MNTSVLCPKCNHALLLTEDETVLYCAHCALYREPTGKAPKAPPIAPQPMEVGNDDGVGFRVPSVAATAGTLLGQSDPLVKAPKKKARNADEDTPALSL